MEIVVGRGGLHDVESCNQEQGKGRNYAAAFENDGPVHVAWSSSALLLREGKAITQQLIFIFFVGLKNDHHFPKLYIHLFLFLCDEKWKDLDVEKRTKSASKNVEVHAWSLSLLFF